MSIIVASDHEVHLKLSGSWYIKRIKYGINTCLSFVFLVAIIYFGEAYLIMLMSSILSLVSNDGNLLLQACTMHFHWYDIEPYY